MDKGRLLSSNYFMLLHYLKMKLVAAVGHNNMTTFVYALIHIKTWHHTNGAHWALVQSSLGSMSEFDKKNQGFAYTGK